MGRTPSDYDIATDAVPDVVQSIFPRAVPVGAAFGVMLVRHLGVTVEIATFREESGYSDRRRPDTVRFSDAEHDAHRRDFTINGLFRDPATDEVHDFVGGQADLDARVLRAIGSADDRLNEDHLRMLRAVRFVAKLGVTLDSDTEAAITRHAPDLQGVSRERIGDEVRRILGCNGRVTGVALLERLGLGAVVIGSPAGSTRLNRLDALCEPGLAACLAAWSLDRCGGTLDIDATVTAWRASLLLSNEQRDGMRSCLQAMQAFGEWASLGTAKRKRLASRSWTAACLSMIAAVDADQSESISVDIAELAKSELSPPRLLSGDALLADGMPAGPDFGSVLEAVYDAQLEGTIATTDAAIALARQLARR